MSDEQIEKMVKAQKQMFDSMLAGANLLSSFPVVMEEGDREPYDNEISRKLEPLFGEETAPQSERCLLYTSFEFLLPDWNPYGSNPNKEAKSL